MTLSQVDKSLNDMDGHRSESLQRDNQAEDEETPDEWLSDHCCAMRRALNDCQLRWKRLQHQQKPAINFEERSSSSKPMDTGASITDCGWYDIVEFPEDDETISSEAVYAFVQQYLLRNRPCLIRGLANHQNYFGRVIDQWKDPAHMRQWIRQHAFLAPLPVRHPVQSTDSSAGGDNDLLDDDGRATECPTYATSIDEWIQYLDDCRNNNSNDKDAAVGQHWYLKDWHLEQALEAHGTMLTNDLSDEADNNKPTDNATIGSTQPTSPPSTSSSLSYTLPPFFAHDLLNPFLQRFTGGDYRFVYWGPQDSTTEWHSDVLHSFSWSFNVFGRKEWTFEVPIQHDEFTLDNLPTSHTNNSPANRHETIQQHAGEVVFVPSQWRHRVVNLEETLSINRNWMTAAQISRVWECLRQEQVAITQELQAWGADSDENMDAHESMLRGCVGLDVTAFVLMILYRVVELLEHANRTDSNEEDHDSATGMMRDWELCSLAKFLKDNIMNDASQHEIRLLERLQGTLSSAKLGQEAFDLLHQVIGGLYKGFGR